MTQGTVFEEAADREAAERAAQAVSTVVERAETVAGLDAGTRAALYALLTSIADNKYVLGRRYAEWCTGAPMLESAVAAAAMAQDELGHARSFYPLLRGFPEADAAAAMEEQGWSDRPTNAIAALDAHFHDWASFVAANFVVDTALTVLFEAATESRYEPLRQRARKIVQEEQTHWVHGEGWIRRLARDPASRPSIAARLRSMWADTFAWFGQADDATMTTLEKADILAAGPDELRARLGRRLAATLSEAGLAEELVSESLPWGRWDAQRRRLRPA